MNIFSNLGVTELIVILLLAVIVVGPERLPELARQLAKVLRDLRQMYENLTSELGPELMSIQETTQELRDSVDSVRSIPQDMVQSLAKAAELDETMEELKDVTDSIGQVSQTLSDAGRVIKDPLAATASAAQSALSPGEAADKEQVQQEKAAGTEEAVGEEGPVGRKDVQGEKEAAGQEEVEEEEAAGQEEAEEKETADDPEAEQAHE